MLEKRFASHGTEVRQVSADYWKGGRTCYIATAMFIFFDFISSNQFFTFVCHLGSCKRCDGVFWLPKLVSVDFVTGLRNNTSMSTSTKSGGM